MGVLTEFIEWVYVKWTCKEGLSRECIESNVSNTYLPTLTPSMAGRVIKARLLVS